MAQNLPRRVITVARSDKPIDYKLDLVLLLLVLRNALR